MRIYGIDVECPSAPVPGMLRRFNVERKTFLIAAACTLKCTSLPPECNVWQSESEILATVPSITVWDGIDTRYARTTICTIQLDHVDCIWYENVSLWRRVRVFAE